MFFNIGGLELLVIAMVALIVVGPEQLPGLMRQIGKYARQARSMSSALRDEFMSGIEEVQDLTKPKSWMGKGSDDDPIVPEGFADRVNAESKNGSSEPDGGDESTKPEATEPAEANAESKAPAETDDGDASTAPPVTKPRISQVAQANSSQAVVEAAAAAEAAAAEAEDAAAADRAAAEAAAPEPAIPAERDDEGAEGGNAAESGADERADETAS